jgi:hypothetical protein
MKKIMVFLAAAMIVLAASTAWAVMTIDVFETAEGVAPTVNTTGFLLSTPTVVKGSEFATVSGSLLGGNLSATNFGFRMREPPAGEVTSDFAILALFPTFTDPVFGLRSQPFNLAFISDGATDFDITYNFFNSSYTLHYGTFAVALADYKSFRDQGYITELGGAVFPEDGTLQNLLTVTPDFLVINAQSDLDVSPAPVPGSILLFGTGLLGFVPVWRLSRKA